MGIVGVKNGEISLTQIQQSEGMPRRLVKLCILRRIIGSADDQLIAKGMAHQFLSSVDHLDVAMYAVGLPFLFICRSRLITLQDGHYFLSIDFVAPVRGRGVKFFKPRKGLREGGMEASSRTNSSSTGRLAIHNR